MNEIDNNFLLAGDKFMPEMHLKQPGFTYSACEQFTKNKEKIQKFKETGDISYVYKNELDKTCFQHYMAYGDFKDIERRTTSDKVLRDKAFNIAENLKYDGYQNGLASMAYKIFDKKDKKGLSIVDAFQKILDDSNRKPHKIWVDKGNEFYNNFFKKWLKDNDIEMYSTHNEGKAVAAERFIRTLNTKIYKYMFSCQTLWWRKIYISIN